MKPALILTQPEWEPTVLDLMLNKDETERVGEGDNCSEANSTSPQPVLLARSGHRLLVEEHSRDKRYFEPRAAGQVVEAEVDARNDGPKEISLLEREGRNGYL